VTDVPDHIRRAADEAPDHDDTPSPAELEQDEREARAARERWRREHIIKDRDGWEYWND
jgi:hypothetical protein